MYEPKTKNIMRTKGIGPRNLGLPKSPVKQIYTEEEYQRMHTNPTEAETRLQKAKMQLTQSEVNKRAADLENQSERLNLKAQKRDRQISRKQKRLNRKDDTGQTGVGATITGIKNIFNK